MSDTLNVFKTKLNSILKKISWTNKLHEYFSDFKRVLIEANKNGPSMNAGNNEQEEEPKHVNIQLQKLNSKPKVSRTVSSLSMHYF